MKISPKTTSRINLPNRACVLECSGCDTAFEGYSPQESGKNDEPPTAFQSGVALRLPPHSRTLRWFGELMKCLRDFKYLTFKLLVFVLWLALVTGCNRQTVLVPTEIHYGVETCAECGMIINDPHYAAAVAYCDSSDNSIQTAVFDDIGCLLEWRHHHAGVQIAAVWTKNVRTGEWLDATSAIYLKNPQLHTPMGGGIAAGATPNDFAALPVRQPILAWTNLEGRASSLSPGHPDNN